MLDRLNESHESLSPLEGSLRGGGRRFSPDRQTIKFPRENNAFGPKWAQTLARHTAGRAPAPQNSALPGKPETKGNCRKPKEIFAFRPIWCSGRPGTPRDRPGTPRDGPGTPRDRPGTARGPPRDRRGACPRPPQRSCHVQELSSSLPGAAPGRPSAPRAAPALPELARSCPGPASMPAQSSQELPRAPQKLSKT